MRKKIFNFILVFVFMLNQISILPAYATGTNAEGDKVIINRTVNGSNLEVGDTFIVDYTITPKSIAVDYDSIFGEYKDKLYKKFQKDNEMIQMKQYWFEGKNNFASVDDKFYEIVAHGNDRELTQDEKKELQEGKIIEVNNDYYRDITELFSQKMNVNATAHFQESFSQGLEVVNPENLPQGLRVEENKIVGDIPVYYSKHEDKFKAEDISFNINYKVKENTPYTLGVNKGSFVEYTLGGDYKGYEKEYLNEVQISVLQLINVVKQGIFVKDDKANKYIVGGNESEEDKVKVNSIDIIRTMVHHIGVMVEVNNNKSKFEIEVDSRYNTGNAKLNIYELNNGILNRTPVYNATCKLNQMNNEFLKYQFENGKTYIIQYTFITNAQENTQVVNKVKIDNAEVAKLKMLVEKLPELD